MLNFFIILLTCTCYTEIYQDFNLIDSNSYTYLNSIKDVIHYSNKHIKLINLSNPIYINSISKDSKSNVIISCSQEITNFLKINLLIHNSTYISLDDTNSFHNFKDFSFSINNISYISKNKSQIIDYFNRSSYKLAIESFEYKCNHDFDLYLFEK